MGITSLILGILSLMGVCISLIPLLNILNCITLPMALIGLILGIADVVRKKGQPKGKGAAIAGLTLNGLALLIGIIRVVISLITTGGIV
jgi:hypothetical protein